mmetsp:Transcript_16807/g.40556  ORF Transcript_16807/g.40556 Transcript_16807/m.40556 type:complete len:391 (-) Transcript_16807:426-1598(-)
MRADLVGREVQRDGLCARHGVCADLGLDVDRGDEQLAASARGDRVHAHHLHVRRFDVGSGRDPALVRALVGAELRLRLLEARHERDDLLGVGVVAGADEGAGARVLEELLALGLAAAPRVQGPKSLCALRVVRLHEACLLPLRGEVLQVAVHVHDLHVLSVDDGSQHGPHKSVFAQLRIRSGHSLPSHLEQHLCHVDGVLVVGDHLAHKSLDRVVRRPVGGAHVVRHVAVHRLHALLELVLLPAQVEGLARPAVSSEMRRAERVAVVRGRSGPARHVLVRQRHRVIQLDGPSTVGCPCRAVCVRDHDLPGHPFMDMAEVEDLRGRVIRDTKIHAVLVLAPQPLRPVLELRLVYVQPERSISRSTAKERRPIGPAIVHWRLAALVRVAASS